MALFRKDKPTALFASAAMVPMDDREWFTLMRKRRQEWQMEAFTYRACIGEVHYATEHRANVISRLRLYVACRPDPAEEPVAAVEVPELADRARRATEALDMLGDAEEKAEILHRISANRSVAGEMWLLGMDPQGDQQTQWTVRSVRELTIQGEGFALKEAPDDPNGLPIIPVDLVRPPEGTARGANAYVQRIWQKDPEWSALADSPMRGVLDICQEIVTKGLAMRAEDRSRIPAGLLAMPDSLSFGPADPTKNSGGALSTQEQFKRTFHEALITAVQNEGSAGAFAPNVVWGNREDLAAIRLIDLGRTTGEKARAERNELLTRLAQGLNLPPERILGFGDANHWGSAQIGVDEFAGHDEPDAIFCVNALTKAFLHPMLRAMGVDTAGLFVWYDATEVVTQPNRAQDAKDAHAALVISDAALRRYLGMPDEDKPDEAELARRAPALGGFGGPEPAEEQPTEPEDGGVGQTGTAPEPADDDLAPVVAAVRPRRKVSGVPLALMDRDLRTRLHAAMQDTAVRALERAGNRLRAKLQGADAKLKAAVKDLPAWQVPRALGPTVAASLGFTDDMLLAGALDGFEEKWDRAVRFTQEQSASVAARFAGRDTQVVLTRLTPVFEQNRARGYERVEAGLLAAIRAELWPPLTAAGAPIVLDFTESLSLLRAGLAEAGGLLAGSGGIGRDNLPALPDEYVRGVATGGTVVELLAESGISEAGFTWLYGSPDTRQQPFDGHLALDGGEFSGPDDPGLEVNYADAWLGTTHYYVGDHDYCQCDQAPFFTVEAPLGLEDTAVAELRKGAQEAISILAASAAPRPPRPEPVKAKAKAGK